MAAASAAPSTTAAVACVASLRARIAQRWPIAIDDPAVLTLGLACTLANAGDVIDLVCSRALAPIVKRDAASLQLNADELVMLLSIVALRGVAPDIVQGEEFAGRRRRVEAALQCTLAEANGARLWARPSTQLAVVLSFQAQAPPFPTLDALFGSVVRADVRRAEDLHFSELADPLSTMEMTRLLEAVARAVLA